MPQEPNALTDDELEHLYLDSLLPQQPEDLKIRRLVTEVRRLRAESGALEQAHRVSSSADILRLRALVATAREFVMPPGLGSCPGCAETVHHIMDRGPEARLSKGAHNANCPVAGRGTMRLETEVRTVRG
jgi:hypothetical protein